MKNYKQKEWNIIIPKLLEIAILNLYDTYKKTFFSKEDLSEIIKILLNNEKINNDINDNNFYISKKEYKRKNSHRSFPKYIKNINELNIYTNYNIDNKIIHLYNRSSTAKPIKRLINTIETEGSLQKNKFKKFLKLDKNLNKNRINEKNNNNIINYNTIDISNIYEPEKSYLNINKCILLDNSNEKEYIKVNKVEKLKKNNINVENLHINNTYIKDINYPNNNKIDRIVENSKIRLFNNLKTKEINIINSNKDKDNKYNENYYFQSENNSIIYKPNKTYTEVNSVERAKKIKNEIKNNKNNMKKIIINEFKNKYFSNINDDIFFEKNEKLYKNKILMKNKMNFNDENINDISSNYIHSNRNIKQKNKRKFKLKSKNKCNIINYNSFNSDFNSNKRKSLNNPDFFIKTSKKRNYNKLNIIRY